MSPGASSRRNWKIGAARHVLVIGLVVIDGRGRMARKSPGRLALRIELGHAANANHLKHPAQAARNAPVNLYLDGQPRRHAAFHTLKRAFEGGHAPANAKLASTLGAIDTRR